MAKKSKLTEDQLNEIVARIKSGERPARLATEYGVSRQAIFNRLKFLSEEGEPVERKKGVSWMTIPEEQAMVARIQQGPPVGAHSWTVKLLRQYARKEFGKMLYLPQLRNWCWKHKIYDYEVMPDGSRAMEPKAKPNRSGISGKLRGANRWADMQWRGFNSGYKPKFTVGQVGLPPGQESIAPGQGPSGPMGPYKPFTGEEMPSYSGRGRPPKALDQMPLGYEGGVVPPTQTELDKMIGLYRRMQEDQEKKAAPNPLKDLPPLHGKRTGKHSGTTRNAPKKKKKR